MANVHNKTNVTQKDHLAMQCKGECATQGGSHWVKQSENTIGNPGFQLV